MKKTIAALLCLCLFLTACGKQPEQTEPETPAVAPQQPEPTQPEQEQQPSAPDAGGESDGAGAVVPEANGEPVEGE